MIKSFRGKHPRIGKNVFIAPNAVIIGDVVIEDHASIWYCTVVRGDRSPIRIGAYSNIQDNSTVHTEPEHPVTVGAHVTVGHNAVIHGCVVEEACLIGIGAVVLNGAVIGQGSIVAAHSLVKEGQVVDAHRLVAGVPAKVKRELTPAGVERFKATAEGYAALAAEHLLLFDDNLR
ncbi:MAG TPA: gamma carbonic anhydrase family protein [Desulfobacteraceae bacterium]|nr:gamma carbonic anhydrase family protein [Desulfobacteraceae bacterium]